MAYKNMGNTETHTDIWVHGRKFSPYIDRYAIRARVEELGKEITRDYAGRQPFFLGVLNGAFMFVSDLVRACDLECEVGFIRLSSYSGMQSSGQVRTLLGVNAEIQDRPIIVVEDIIDSGRTMALLLQDLQKYAPASVEVVSLLSKPDALEVPLDIRLVGFEIPNAFVLGYGLDYDGIGRNLPEIYQLNEA
jgi:hypoxanthine phosphoribosyltransferase